MGTTSLWLALRQLCGFAVFITGQDKGTPDAPTGHKWRKKPGRELHGASISTFGNDFVDTTAVVLQILLGREVQVEIKAIHRQDASEVSRR